MAKTTSAVGAGRQPEQKGTKTRHQWHPDIPMAETFKPGEEFRVECRDWARSRLTNDSRDASPSEVHYLGTSFDVAGTMCASHTTPGL